MLGGVTSGIFGASGLGESPHRLFHQPPIFSPTPDSTPDTLDSSEAAPPATPSPRVVIIRCPDRVRVERGPVLASENGRYSRIVDRMLPMASIGAIAMLFIPSTKVESRRAPDSKRLMLSKKAMILAQPSRMASPTPKRLPSMANISPILAKTARKAAAAEGISPVNRDTSKPNPLARFSTPKATNSMIPARTRNTADRAPPSTSPKERALEAALVTSPPKTLLNSLPSVSRILDKARPTGANASVIGEKSRASHRPVKNSLMRYTARATVDTSPTSPAALISVASSPRISPLPSFRDWKSAKTPLTTRVMFFHQRFRVSAMPPKFVL